MARQFSIPTLLRMTPNVLLARFFSALGLKDVGIAWDRLKEREIEPVLRCLSELPGEQLDRVETAMRTVYELSSATGIDAILQAADESDEACILSMIPETAGYYAIAMWNWLAYPEVFDRAARIHQVPQLHWWRKRNDVPRVAPDLSPQAIGLLEQDVSTVLLREQGRGKICTIETTSRGGVDYLFIYPDDFVQLVHTHDDQGDLEAGTIRPTLQIVFAYRRDEGSLELFAKLPARVKRMLEETFVRRMLKREIGAWTSEAAYQLDHLKHADFQLDTDPWDRVQARIRRLRLAIKGAGRKIWVEVDVDDPTDCLPQALAECLDEEHVPLQAVLVTRATFTVDFLPQEGRKPGRLTFEVGVPDSCTVRSERPERIELVHKYLKRWGVDRVQAAQPDLVSA